jgi:hypothetical protein
MLLSLGILEKWNIGMLVFVHYSNIPVLHYSQFALKNELLRNFSKLIKIIDSSITLYNYYFPLSKKLTIPFSDKEKIVTKTPTLFTGKFRYWGSGNFITWFPRNFKRNSRDKIFIVYRKNKKIKIGFTVKDSQKVFELLFLKNLFV